MLGLHVGAGAVVQVEERVDVEVECIKVGAHAREDAGTCGRRVGRGPGGGLCKGEYALIRSPDGLLRAAGGGSALQLCWAAAPRVQPALSC